MVVSRRWVSIVVGYAAACVVASAMFVIALTWSGGAREGWGPFDLGLLSAFASLTGIVALFVAMLALLPTLAVGIYAERRRVRAPQLYACAGGLVGLAGLALYVLVLYANTASGERFSLGEGEQDLRSFLVWIVVIVAGAGVLSGLTYWAIAGRNAGGARPSGRE